MDVASLSRDGAENDRFWRGRTERWLDVASLSRDGAENDRIWRGRTVFIGLKRHKAQSPGERYVQRETSFYSKGF